MVSLKSELYARYQEFKLGGSGPKPVTGTSAVTGEFFAMEAGASGCTISAIAGLPDSWTNFQLAAGQRIDFGARLVTSITLSAGTAIAYRR